MLFFKHLRVNMHRLVPHRDNFGSNAPIVEALIDLAAPTTVEVGELRALANELAGEASYDVVDQVALDLAFKLDHTGASATGGATPRGFLLRSRDGSRAVQLRRDGFTMSHLRPYGTWEDLRGDAKAFWPRFADAGKVAVLQRVAVRFINRLELPPAPLEHWLTLAPRTPAALQQEPAEFAMRTVHVHPQTGALGVVNLVQEFRDLAGPRIIILDVDCFYHNLTLSPADQAIWEKLAELREFKNDIFFGSITAHTEALFR